MATSEDGQCDSEENQEDDSAAEMESDNAVLDDAVNGKELTSPLPATSDHDFSLAGFLTKCGQIWGARTFFTLTASTSLVHVLPAVSHVGETLNLDHCLVPESAEPGSDQMGSAESSPNGKECFPQKSGTIPDESTLASGIRPDKSSLHPPISKQPPSTTEGPLPRERIAFITLTSTTTTPVKKWERPYFLVECHNPDSSMRPFEAQFDNHSSQHEPLSDDTVQHT